MQVSAIKLMRIGSDAVVLIEVAGVWAEVIREPYDGAFSHIVEQGGMLSAVKAANASRYAASESLKTFEDTPNA